MTEKITFNVLQTNPDGTKAEVEISFSTWELKKHLTEKALADLLDEYNNNYDDQYKKGQRIAEHLFYTHPTGQANVIRFVLGILTGFAEKTDFIDGRNETPIAMCKKIKELVDDGTLEKGYMV
jgi:hypothetical protein